MRPYRQRRLGTTFDDALGSFMEADGIILDLRGNGGGKDAMALGMMGWLAPSEWVAGRTGPERRFPRDIAVGSLLDLPEGVRFDQEVH